MQSIIRQNLLFLKRVGSTMTGSRLVARSMSASVTDNYKFETLEVTSPKDFVYHVELNRPDKLNAMNLAFWREIKECFQKMTQDENCRVVVLSGRGRLFTAGLDLVDAASVLQGGEGSDVGRKLMRNLPMIRTFQSSFTSMEECPKPVIAAIHNGCIGGGVDMTAACDIRYCTNDAFFQIKEVDLGITADVGTLQRFPKVIGNDSLARELAFTARRMYAAEAMQCGYVSRVFDNKEAMLAGALDTGALIAEKSPVGVQGSKVNMVYSRDHSVAESLEYVATWNAGMLQSEDVMEAATAFMQKKKPTFSKL